MTATAQDEVKQADEEQTVHPSIAAVAELHELTLEELLAGAELSEKQVIIAGMGYVTIRRLSRGEVQLATERSTDIVNGEKVGNDAKFQQEIIRASVVSPRLTVKAADTLYQGAFAVYSSLSNEVYKFNRLGGYARQDAGAAF